MYWCIGVVSRAESKWRALNLVVFWGSTFIILWAFFKSKDLCVYMFWCYSLQTSFFSFLPHACSPHINIIIVLFNQSKNLKQRTQAYSASVMMSPSPLSLLCSKSTTFEYMFKLYQLCIFGMWCFLCFFSLVCLLAVQGPTQLNKI